VRAHPLFHPCRSRQRPHKIVDNRVNIRAALPRRGVADVPRRGANHAPPKMGPDHQHLLDGGRDRRAPLDPHRSGHLKLDEVITQRYSLEQVNYGYRDVLAGKNIRGVVIHES